MFRRQFISFLSIPQHLKIIPASRCLCDFLSYANCYSPINGSPVGKLKWNTILNFFPSSPERELVRFLIMRFSASNLPPNDEEWEQNFLFLSSTGEWREILHEGKIFEYRTKERRNGKCLMGIAKSASAASRHPNRWQLLIRYVNKMLKNKKNIISS